MPENTGREMNRYYERRIVMKVLGKAARQLFFPYPLKVIWTVCESIPYLLEGIRTLVSGKVEVPVLDASAILASILRKDYSTASSVMFLLGLGELLEEWTHRKSVDNLARSMSLKVDKVWLKTSGADVLADISSIKQGDRIVVRTSNIIPLDGRVVEGAATVNQSTMTGESEPVEKTAGGYVYAGTIVEHGELTVEITKTAGKGKYDQIVRMIEETEKLKSETETAAYHLADRLVPWSLAGAGIVFLLTRNVNRALSFLMVDFSCTLKLSMPLSVLSAIREAGLRGITVKGGKSLEAAAQADTIVFDKTGTLTHARPALVQIVTFGGFSDVDEAKKRGIEHDEMHSKVQYVVAHGISSSIAGKKAVIGSYHFVFEDEKCTVPEGEQDKLKGLPDEYSRLYLALDGAVIAVLCIFDPLREEAAQVIAGLHRLGIDRVCMLTGDNKRTAAAIARRIRLDVYQAEVLPEDKASFIAQEHKNGRRVIMVGDGINDTPALSEADCGVAVSDGAAIAREVADITITQDSLYQILFLREISTKLMERIRSNYRFIITFNSALILLGVAAILPPAASALLHNTSTIFAGLHCMTDLLPEKDSRP